MGSPRPNPWVNSLAPYIPGQSRVDGLERVAKLSANESPLGPSPAAREAVATASGMLHVYPDPDAGALREAIAAHHGLDPARVVCGAGSDDLLHLIAQAYAGPGDQIVHSRYGFAMYPILAHMAGATSVQVENRNWAADVDGILAAVTEKTRIVFLDNPNNPTGAYLPASELERLAAGLPESCLLVYDAAYAESADAADYTDGARLAHEAGNVFMTRTFSKTYGLAALRIGWGYGNTETVEVINRIRMPFNTAMPAQAAAAAALADQAFLGEVREFTIRWRRWLTDELRAAGLEVVDSQTNFVLMRFPRKPGATAEEANRYLAARGFLLRWLPGQGLEDCLRLTIGTEEQNRAVLTHLREFLAGAPRAAASRG